MTRMRNLLGPAIVVMAVGLVITATALAVGSNPPRTGMQAGLNDADAVFTSATVVAPAR